MSVSFLKIVDKSVQDNISDHLFILGAIYLQSVLWTLNFSKKNWISIKMSQNTGLTFSSSKILDFNKNSKSQNTGLL